MPGSHVRIGMQSGEIRGGLLKLGLMMETGYDDLVIGDGCAGKQRGNWDAERRNQRRVGEV